MVVEYTQEELQSLSPELVALLYTEGKLNKLKDIRLTSNHIFELPGNILESMIRSGFLHTEPS
jgi:hypothetical protein